MKKSSDCRFHHVTAMRGYHKHTVLLYDQFKACMSIGNLIKCQSTKRDFISSCEWCHISENSLPAGGGVQGTCSHRHRCGYVAVLSIMAAQMMMASSDPDIQAHPLQIAMCVMQMLLSERTATLSWMTWPKTWTFRLVLHTALSMTNWITEKCVHPGCQKTSQTITKLVL